MFNPAETIETQIEIVPFDSVTVLVLDDSEVDRKRVLRLCRDAGLNMTAVEAGTLSEMGTALKATQFDIVFIDYLLMGEDGLDAVEMLTQAENQSAVLIMVAGEGRIDIAVEAMRRGCSDYLIKSNLSVEALRKSVATALERRMMNVALNDERKKRHRLEQAVRRYAKSSAVEMRTILAGALRRVRKLRTLSLSGEHATHIAELEHSIDRLWDALPHLGKQVDIALAMTEEAPRAIMHRPGGAPPELNQRDERSETADPCGA